MQSTTEEVFQVQVHLLAQEAGIFLGIEGRLKLGKHSWLWGEKGVQGRHAVTSGGRVSPAKATNGARTSLCSAH